MTEPVAEKDTCAALVAKCEELGIEPPKTEWLYVEYGSGKWEVRHERLAGACLSLVPAFTTGALLVWMTGKKGAGMIVCMEHSSFGLADVWWWETGYLGGSRISGYNAAEALAQLALATMDKWHSKTR